MPKDLTVYDARFFQTTTTRNLDRLDHIWWARKGGYKCVLCGAVTKSKPPPYRSGMSDWVPDTYERLTDEDRERCPFVDITLGLKQAVGK